MKLHHRIQTLYRLCAAVALAALMLLPGASSALALPPAAPEFSEWHVTISGLSGPACVGEAYLLTVRWFPAGDGLLAPLTGPKVISVSTKLGALDHETERAGAPSGTAVFRYSAKKAGGELVTVRAFNHNLEVDASATAQFEVEKCAYRYELYAELYDDLVDGDTAIGYLLIYRSKGTLVAPDPDQPDHLESNAELIHFMLTATYFRAPGCSYFTSQPGTGIGHIDVKAEPAQNGLGLHVSISPPREAGWDISNTIVCDGEPSTASGNFPISSSADPWIEKDFPTGGGAYPVTIDILEETVANARGKGHIISYSARLKLERVVQ